MRYIRAAVLLEAVLLYACGMMCLAYPRALHALGLTFGASDINTRCTFGLLLMSSAVLLVQITTDTARFRPLLFMSLSLAAISAIGLGLLYALRGIGNGVQVLAAAIAVLTLIAFLAVSRAISRRVANARLPEDLTSLPSIRPDSTSSALSLHQARMKYAWDWFQYHADQRLKAFNFFLILLGILIAGYGAAMKESLTNAAAVACSAVPATSTTIKTSKTSTTGVNSKTSTTLSTPAISTTQEASTTSTSPSNAGAATAAISYSTFALVVALCGALISTAFYMIEIRNAELVECGRKWLDVLEKRLGMSVRENDNGRRYLPDAVDWLTGALVLVPSYVKHQFWIRAIYVLAAFMFLAAAYYASKDFTIK